MAEVFTKPDRMTERCYEVCSRRVMFGAPQEAIGEELGITQQRVCRYLARAEQQFPELVPLLRRSRRGRPRKSA